MLCALVMVAISFAYPTMLAWFVCQDDQNEFGDSYGMLNSVFSGLAFAGVIVTVWMQKSELKDQREELKLQREEFIVNRMTNIVYKQIELFENNHSPFTIEHNSKHEQSGRRAFAKIIDSWVDPLTDMSTFKHEREKMNAYNSLREFIRILRREENELSKYYSDVTRTVKVVREVLESNELDKSIMNHY